MRSSRTLDHLLAAGAFAVALVAPPALVVATAESGDARAAASEDVVHWAREIGIPAGIALALVISMMLVKRSLAPMITTLGAVYFVAVMVWMHLTVPEVSVLAAPCSLYVLHDPGAWVTSVYFALAATVVAMGIAVVGIAPPSRSRRISAMIGGLVAGGFFLAGVYRMDPIEQTPKTPVGMLHLIAAMVAFPFLTALPLLLLRAARPALARARWSGLLRVIAWMFPPLLVLLFVTTPLAYGGLVQRIYMATFCLWFPLAAFAVARPSD